MKKLAFFLALFVGLNASGIARKPDEEENQAIVVKDTPRRSTSAIISLIANSLKICYYGITKEGFIQEIRLNLIQKMKKSQASEILVNNPLFIKKETEGKMVWIHINYHFENGCEIIDYQLLKK